MKKIIYYFYRLLYSGKNNGFHIDKNVSLGYLLYFLFDKICDLFRGFLLTGKLFIFIGKNTKIKSRRQFKFKKTLNISNNVFIDAISINGITLGSGCSVGKYTCIECTGSLQNLGKGIIVGNNCGLGTHSFYGCAGGIEIGDDVIVGNYVSMHSENHNFSDKEILIRLQGVNRKGIKIGNNCWIGAKVTILDGTIIGNGCIIAAGAVVNGYFPDNVVIGGVPAKIIKYR
jgi:acetyltransferase-like isoleucine patch superfamily enzyme